MNEDICPLMLFEWPDGWRLRLLWYSYSQGRGALEIDGPVPGIARYIIDSVEFRLRPRWYHQTLSFPDALMAMYRSRQRTLEQYADRLITINELAADGHEVLRFLAEADKVLLP